MTPHTLNVGVFSLDGKTADIDYVIPLGFQKPILAFITYYSTERPGVRDVHWKQDTDRFM